MNSIERQICELERKIADNNRALRDPYEQNKWVEREQNERYQSEINSLRNQLRSGDRN